MFVYFSSAVFRALGHDICNYQLWFICICISTSQFSVCVSAILLWKMPFEILLKNFVQPFVLPFYLSLVSVTVKSAVNDSLSLVYVWGKRFKLPQLTHESFLTIDHSCKIFFWYLPNWTSTNLWCVVLYVTYSTTHQRSVEVQFGRYQKNILQEGSMVKNLSCVSCAAWNVFPVNSLGEGTSSSLLDTRWSIFIEFLSRPRAQVRSHWG